MKRRGNGEGSFTRKNGRWTHRITIAGVRRSFSGGSRVEVLAAAEEWKRFSKATSNSRVTIAQWFDFWTTHCLEGRRTNTISTYRSLIKNHILPIFGKVCINDLTPEMILRGFDAIKPKAPRSGNIIHTILSMALKQAVANGKAFHPQ